MDSENTDITKMTKLYDISQTLRSSLPVWPGDTSFEIQTTWKMDENCPVQVSRLTLSTHSGTHADAPSHYNDKGASMEEVALSPYLGECLVLHASEGMNAVSFNDLSLSIEPPETLPPRLLIKTFERFPHSNWPEFRGIDPELIHELAGKGIQLIGTDAPSIDPESSKTMDAHKAVQNAGMAILEGLVLEDVPEGRYELIALPLKIQGADASPVRAILRSLTS